MKTHEELISEAMAAYQDSKINYGLDDAQMIAKLRIMNDAFIQHFIQTCKANR